MPAGAEGILVQRGTLQKKNNIYTYIHNIQYLYYTRKTILKQARAWRQVHISEKLPRPVASSQLAKSLHLRSLLRGPPAAALVRDPVWLSDPQARGMLVCRRFLELAQVRNGRDMSPNGAQEWLQEHRRLFFEP